MDGPYIIDDIAGQRFRLNRGVLVDPEILERERESIFGRSWIYVGHESEIGAPGDFKTRNVAGRPVILARDGSGDVRAYLNTCRHRGAMLCREREGNQRRFTCMYHGWTFDIDGKLVGVPGRESYGDSFDAGEFDAAS